MTIAGHLAPDERSTSEIFVTFPDILACIGTETNPPHSAILSPIATTSPTFTVGVAGAPICIDKGIVTELTSVRHAAGLSAVFFLCGVLTPFKKKDI